MEKKTILVSSCLLGENCKYNGESNENQKVIDFVKDYNVVRICPEMMASLGCPRRKIEIKNGRVIDEDGNDYTKKMDGACKQIGKIIDKEAPCLAILKSRSPSCGLNKIYDGTFKHILTQGNGIACSYILKRGIKVITEEDL